MQHAMAMQLHISAAVYLQCAAGFLTTCAGPLLRLLLLLVLVRLLLQHQLLSNNTTAPLLLTTIVQGRC